MSATLPYEPHPLPAGILALAVHGAFFALLYFGFSWQTQPAATMSVELWRSLPDDEVAPPATPVITQAIQPAQPEKLLKPDIALPDKKDKKDKKKVETKPVLSQSKRPVATIPEKKKPVLSSVEGDEAKAAQQILEEQQQAEAVQRERMAAQQAAQAARERAEQAARDKAAQDAAIDAMVNEYVAKIVTKIRRNVPTIPDVASDARAEFLVTLLPGGAVLSARLAKSSGNAAYDNAVERAILKSQPLPLPADAAMFNRFRELNLVFKPAE